VVFLSKNSRLIVSKSSAYQPRGSVLLERVAFLVAATLTAVVRVYNLDVVKEITIKTVRIMRLLFLRKWLALCVEIRQIHFLVVDEFFAFHCCCFT
jgi:hypothetical protein